MTYWLRSELRWITTVKRSSASARVNQDRRVCQKKNLPSILPHISEKKCNLKKNLKKRTPINYFWMSANRLREVGEGRRRNSSVRVIKETVERVCDGLLGKRENFGLLCLRGTLGRGSFRLGCGGVSFNRSTDQSISGTQWIRDAHRFFSLLFLQLKRKI